MTIKAGDQLPAAKNVGDTGRMAIGCPTGADEIQTGEATKGKRIVVFGLPGAYTKTCSTQHLPGFVQDADKLKAKGIDEIWCVSVNDPTVMAAWGADNKAAGKVRMMADGNAEFTKALGMDQDLTARGMGIRSKRYSMLVDNGVVKKFNLEGPGKFEASSADAMLKQL